MRNPPMADISTALLDRRRDNDAYSRITDVQLALRLWRRALIAEMAAAEGALDNEKTETILDLLHGELQECGGLINEVSFAAKRILQRRVEAGHGEGILMFESKFDSGASK